MNIIELNSTHKELIIPLFYSKNYMGVDVHSTYFVDTDNATVEEVFYQTFVDTYLSGLTNYKALALVDGDEIKSLISFYMSPDEPSWYGTMIRSLKDKNYVRPLLDAAMSYNEERGRLKFYTLWSAGHAKLLRRFAFSKEASERYDYVDELFIPARTKCFYTNYWQILFNRTLIPTDTVIRCTFLKQQYRTNLPVGGNL